MIPIKERPLLPSKDTPNWFSEKIQGERFPNQEPGKLALFIKTEWDYPFKIILGINYKIQRLEVLAKEINAAKNTTIVQKIWTVLKVAALVMVTVGAFFGSLWGLGLAAGALGAGLSLPLTYFCTLAGLCSFAGSSGVMSVFVMALWDTFSSLSSKIGRFELSARDLNVDLGILEKVSEKSKGERIELKSELDKISEENRTSPQNLMYQSLEEWAKVDKFLLSTKRN